MHSKFKKENLFSSSNFIIIDSLNNDLKISFLTLVNGVYYTPSYITLEDRGKDPRIDALADYIFNKLKGESDFLRDSNDRSSEIENFKKDAPKQWLNRLNSEEWLNRSNTKEFFNEKVVIKNKPCTVKVIKEEVEEKTDDYVNNLLEDIEKFCTNMKLDRVELHYVLIGDSFNNKRLISKFTTKFGDDSLTIFPKSNIVNIFTDIGDILTESFKYNKSTNDAKNEEETINTITINFDEEFQNFTRNIEESGKAKDLLEVEYSELEEKGYILLLYWFFLPTKKKKNNGFELITVEFHRLIESIQEQINSAQNPYIKLIMDGNSVDLKDAETDKDKDLTTFNGEKLWKRQINKYLTKIEKEESKELLITEEIAALRRNFEYLMRQLKPYLLATIVNSFKQN